MSERVRQLLSERFEPRRTVLRGTVTSAPLVEGRSAGYVVATVGGQAGVKVRCNPDQQPPFAPGDVIDCQSYGSPSSTWYYALNLVAGVRAASGSREFTQEETYNGTTYQPGDQLLGSTLPGKANWWYVYESGHWRIRSGENVRGAMGNLQGLYGYDEQTYGVAFGPQDGSWIGIDETNGIRMMRAEAQLAQWHEDEIRLGETGQPQLRLAPGAIEFLSGDGTVQAGFDGTTRTVYGFDRWGRPLGPALEIGPTDAGRYGFWLRGQDNVPFVSMLSGTDGDPDDVRFRIGPAGATSYLEWADDTLTVVGNVTILNSGGSTSVAWDDVTGKPATLGTPGAAGLYLTSGYLGFWDGAAWKSYIDSSGNMALGTKLSWNGTTLSINGSVTSTSGTIGGWTLGATSLVAGSGSSTVGLDSGGTNPAFYAGSATPASAPFRVSKAGALVSTSATIGGWDIDAVGIGSGGIWLGSSPTVARITLGSTTWGQDGMQIDTNSGDPRVYIGNGSDKYFKFDGTNISWAAANCTLSTAGVLTVGGSPNITLTGSTATIASSTFVSGTSGWAITGVGLAEFENIVARGSIKTATFEKSLISAFAGSQVISKSASTVNTADVTLSGTTFTVRVRKQDGAAPFANGDLVYLKTATLATYASVNAGSAAGDDWTYTATYKSGNASGTIPIGSTVIDYGPDTAGRIMLTADQTNAPYLSIATHNMDATPVWTERVRLGLLTGITGASGYGLWTDNGYFTGTVNWGGILTGTTYKGVMDATGLSYTYATNESVVINGASTNAMFRVTCQGSAINNGVLVSMKARQYGVAVENSGVNIGGGIRSDIKVGLDGSDGADIGYGFYANLSANTSGGPENKYYGYLSQIIGSRDGEWGYAFYADVQMAGASPMAVFTFYGQGGNVYNSGYIETADVFKVDGKQVVREQQVDARCDDTINTSTWDSTTAGVLDALRDAMITHGLIAAS